MRVSKGLPSLYQTGARAKLAAARNFKKMVVDAAVDTFSELAEFREHWEEAKLRLGVQEAGSTLEIFLRKNTRAIPLDPWTEPEGLSYVRTTGSLNPKTYDSLLFLVRLPPTTSEPAIYDPITKVVLPVRDADVIVRISMWTYGAVYPKPGKGLRLQSWETVSALTARFTVPYLMNATEMDDADPMNLGTAEGIWTDETSEREIYELHR